MVIGLIGLVLCHRRSYFNIGYFTFPFLNINSNLAYVINVCGISLEGELWGWKCFYAGVTSVAFGSSYYHLHPDNASLLWDRIPVSFNSKFKELLFFSSYASSQF